MKQSVFIDLFCFSTLPLFRYEEEMLEQVSNKLLEFQSFKAEECSQMYCLHGMISNHRTMQLKQTRRTKKYLRGFDEKGP